MCARLTVGDSAQSRSVTTFSNDRLFSLNLTCFNFSQYPHACIFYIFYVFLLVFLP